MIDLLLMAEARPFAIALALFGGLLALELLGLMVGLSMMSFDLDVDVDVDVDADGDTGFLAALGIGEVPFILWFASFLVGYGLSGLALQGLAGATLGSPLSPWIMGVVALVPGLLFAREVGSVLLRLVRPEHNTAVSRNRLGRRTGIITQGTASADRPAEARVRDVHGNLQYIRVRPEPGRPDIPQGTEVYIRAQRDGTFTAVPLTDI